MTSSRGAGGRVKRPLRSLHLPSRAPPDWRYFVVVRASTPPGLGPTSIWALTASLRVARSKAALIPVLTRVRLSVPGVTRLRRGETSLDDALVASESRRGVRARALELLSRSVLGAIGLEEGPTPSASTDRADATPARAWPPARQSSTLQSSCVS